MREYFPWHAQHSLSNIIDNAYRMCINVALLTGMMKRITDKINFDRVKEASNSSSGIYSVGVNISTGCIFGPAACTGISYRDG